MNSKNNFKYSVLSIVSVLSIALVWFGDKSSVLQLTEEDGVIESITAVFYLFGFIIGLITIFKRKRLFFPIIWTILCFLFLGEETSWFQRILNYSVPAVENVSEQNEFNLHNLNVFEGESLFVDGKLNKNGLIGFFMSSQNMFRLGFFGYFLILPVLLFMSRFNKFMKKIGYVKTDYKFILILCVVFGLSFILAIYSPVDTKMAFAEVREMLYAFFIFMYICVYIWPHYKFNYSMAKIEKGIMH